MIIHPTSFSKWSGGRGTAIYLIHMINETMISQSDPFAIDYNGRLPMMNVISGNLKRVNSVNADRTGCRIFKQYCDSE